MSRGGIYFGYKKIKFLQSLAWWVKYLTLQGKYIDLNNFKSDVLSEVIKEYQLEFEYARDVKGEMINPT